MKKELIIEALEAFEGKLLRYAMQLLGNQEQARDVVQDTFLSMWKESGDEVRNHLAPWLFRVCRNRVFDVLRKEKRMKALGEKEIVDDNPNVDEKMEKKENSNEIFALIKKLPKNQREVLFLKFQNDLSYAQISEVTGLTISNVGYLIHVGVKAIQQRISSREGA